MNTRGLKTLYYLLIPLLFIAGKVLGESHDLITEGKVIIIISLAMSIGLIAYMLFVLPKRYIIIPILLLITQLGVVLKILHYPMGSLLMMIGYLSDLVMAIMLFARTFSMDKTYLKAITVFRLIPILLLTQSTIAVYFIYYYNIILPAVLTNAGIILIVLWSLLFDRKGMNEFSPEKNLLLLLLVFNTYAIVGFLFSSQ